MSIIIQAGHESSSSEALMKLLYSGGLKKPVLSNVQQLSAVDIAENLSRIINQSQDINNSKLAENIAVDFLLANTNQENWGWADSNNLVASPYWESLEPSSRFILVFDHPKNMFSHLEKEALTKDKVDALMQEWLIYHTTMREFFNSYQSKCLLLEGHFAITQAVKTKDLLKSLSDSLILTTSQEVNLDSSIEKNITVNSNTSIAHDLISEEIIKHYPEVITLFNTLLNKANLKGSNTVYKTKKPDTGTLVSALIDLDEKNSIINSLQKKSKEVEILKEENNALIIAAQASQKSIKDLTNTKNTLQQGFDNNQKEIESYKGLELENNTLVAALHAAQESIEKTTVDKGAVDTKMTKLLNANQILEKEHQLLIRQLHNTQNWLEASYLASQSSTDIEQVGSKSMVLSSGAVSVYHTPRSRVKNDLPYRLGAALVKTKTVRDIVFLPVALNKEYREFLEIKQELESLPPLDKEADILEAEKVKDHLSYRIGNTVTQSLKSPKKLVKLPVSIGKEILKFKK